MPKVTEEYLTNKKKYILECIAEILKEKPLYLITMKDIIKKAGFSQGTIYRYYANIDELYIDYINQNTTEDILDEKISEILNSSQSESVIFYKCFIAMGKYIEEMLETIGGKTCFALVITYFHDVKKRDNVLPRLKFKQDIGLAQNKIVEYTVFNIQKGVFKPKISIQSIVMFASTFIDGVIQTVAMGGETGMEALPVLDVSEMFRMLANTLLGFLEDKICG